MKLSNNIKGLIATALVLLITILIYITKVGSVNHILLTDLLAVLYSSLAVIIGILSVRLYSFKSLHGRVLSLITLGIACWFIAELIWLFTSLRYYSEFFRFLGYLPLIIGFFSILPLSDPAFRKKKRKIFPWFIVFLILSIIYLNILPVILGSTSLLQNILNNGYIVVDFVLLFGIYLLLKTSIQFKKGSLSLGWFIIALAFIPTFIFDVYFAFNFSSYLSGSLFEIFWLSTYILIIFGFFYQYQVMKDFLKPLQKKIKKKSLSDMVFLVIPIALVLIFLISFFAITASDKGYIDNIKSDFVIEYRTDVSVVFTEEVIDTLNTKFEAGEKEYLFCLIGKRDGKKIYVDDLIQPEVFHEGLYIIISKEDPACQNIENAIGSIHSHLVESCEPSLDDIFSWGEMRNPEPIINAIHCQDDIYIVLMPGEHKPLDFNALTWRVE